MNLKKVLTYLLFLSLTSIPVVAQEDSSDVFYFSPDGIMSVEDYEHSPALPTCFEPFNLKPSETVFSQNTKYINIIDPAYSAGYYPGGRGPNQLVVYTPSYGVHTGTNEFGTEAIVEGNIVTSLSGADSAIPENGVVISGHGTAKNWITQNLSVGSKVSIDMMSKTLTVYTTSESYTYEAQAKIDEARSIMNYYSATLKDYSPAKALEHVKLADEYLKLAQNSNSNVELLKKYSHDAMDEASMAIKTSLPYVKDEVHGVWLRPTEQNEQQIIATLDKLKDNGFNNVFLETYYHGKTIFPSKTMNEYGFTVQNENFAGFDPLKTWISEAHKRGIKVHIWFQSFYVGNEPPENNSTSILSVHPEWGNKTRQYADSYGATKSLSEHNGYFLDPANPCVQEFLEDLITEIITDYKPDGINLDYIRYPNSNPKSIASSWGYSEYARSAFMARYGKDPVELTPSDVNWYDWNEFRRNRVTDFVQKIGTLGRENNTYISAVIFPDIASALSSKQQDWRSWSANDYIDGFTPLFLTYDSKMLTSMMRDVLSIKSPHTDLYAGLFVTFMGGSSEDLIRQIFESRKMNANGVILFDYAHTTPVYTSTLMASAFAVPKKEEIKVAVQKKKRLSRRNKKSKKTKASEKQS